MLVLSRQRDETIMIGDDVEITVVDIRGDKVRLGITAPRRIKVHRKEVYDAIKRENEQAATLSPRDVSEAIEQDAVNHRSEEKEVSSDSGTGTTPPRSQGTDAPALPEDSVDAKPCDRPSDSDVPDAPK